MKVLRRVARSGRTVVCTIHQPSAGIFFAFDRLLLLAPGGHQVYFGPLGRHAQALVLYLEGLPRVGRIPPATNPGSWMLSVLEGSAGGGGEGVEEEEESAVLRSGGTPHAQSAGEGAALSPERFAELYTRSALAAENEAALAGFTRSVPPPSAAPEAVVVVAAPALQPGVEEGRGVSGTTTTPTPTAHPLPEGKRTAVSRTLLAQLWLVYVRANVDYSRNTELLTVRLGVNVFLGEWGEQRRLTPAPP